MDDLVDWFIAHGGMLDKSVMALKDIADQGRGAIALKDIPVCSIYLPIHMMAESLHSVLTNLTEERSYALLNTSQLDVVHTNL